MADDNPFGRCDDPFLQTAMERYVRSLDSGASRQNVTTVLKQWLSFAHSRGDDSFEVLDEPQDGPTLMRHYAAMLARRVDDGELAASSAKTYYDTVSGFLGHAVRDGHLDRNPALSNRAREPLPRDTSEADRQFWRDEERTAILRHVDERAHDAIDEHGFDALREVRDRALVYTLAYTGVRGAEILRHPRDDHEGRQGLRWKRVDLDASVMRVLGKSREWEEVPIPRQVHSALRRWRKMLQLPGDDGEEWPVDGEAGEWPVFVTLHRPTLSKALKSALRERGYSESEIEQVVSDDRKHVERIRDYDVRPSAMTTDGARQLMSRLCEAAGIDIDGEPLKLHGARRGIGELVYQQDRGEAQDLLRHKSMETTRQSYTHLEASEQAERVGDLIGDSDAGGDGDDPDDTTAP
jgi:integrase